MRFLVTHNLAYNGRFYEAGTTITLDQTAEGDVITELLSAQAILPLEPFPAEGDGSAADGSTLDPPPDQTVADPAVVADLLAQVEANLAAASSAQTRLTAAVATVRTEVGTGTGPTTGSPTPGGR